MQFIIIGKDGKDTEAASRRANAREAHLKLAKQMKDEAKLLYAAAILDDEGKMQGSMMVVDMPSKADVDNWLKSEPYITLNVWQDVEIHNAMVAPIFQS